MPKSIKGIAGGLEPDDATTRVNREYNGDNGIVTTRSLDIKTLDDLLRTSKVDLTVWEVVRHEVNSWEVTIGARNNGGKRPGTYTNYQVKAWLKRKIPSVLELSLERLLQRVPLAPKARVRAAGSTVQRGAYLLEISLFDAHFGMLAWRRETGDDYDLRIAEESYLASSEDLLAKTAGCRPQKILLPFGNDFLHINNPEGQTPLGKNVLDVDGRLAKVLEAGESAVFKLVDRCLQVAPVHVLWIPGNHDPQTSYYLCRVIREHYRRDERVLVDVEPTTRKYFQWGTTLLGFTHGNEEKERDLPTIMAAEQRAVWSRVRHCEWHLGHYHKAKETRYSAADTFGGVRVRVIPSICGTDAWHFKKGYVKGSRTAEAYLYEQTDGLVAQYTSRSLRRNDGH